MLSTFAPKGSLVLPLRSMRRAIGFRTARHSVFNSNLGHGVGEHYTLECTRAAEGSRARSSWRRATCCPRLPVFFDVRSQAFSTFCVGDDVAFARVIDTVVPY